MPRQYLNEQTVTPNAKPHESGDRPDSRRASRISARLITVALSLAASLAAQDRHPVEVGRNVPLRVITAPVKGDARTQLSQFGLRPTLVVVPGRPKFDKKIPKSYLKRLGQLDRLAGKWRRAGGEVVCLDPGGVIMLSNNKRKGAEVFRRARLNKMFCAAIAEDPLELILESDVQQRHFHQPFEDEPAFRWVLLGERGVVTASGEDVFSKDIKQMLSTLKEPGLAKQKLTEKGFDAINEWRLSLAQREIAGLQAEQPEAAERLQQLLNSCLERHLRDHCAVLSEHGLLVEQGEELQRLAAVADPSTELGKKFAADLKALRASPEYEQAATHRYLRAKMIARLSSAEDAVGAAYDKVAARFSGYDEKVYNKFIVENYPAAIADVSPYVRDHRASPYHREVALLLMELREDLQYARSVVAGKQ